MTIIKTVLQERMRKKFLYVIALLSLLVTLFLSSANSTIAVNGKPITGFEGLFPAVVMLLNLISCALALAVSLGTIPQEYVQERSHLVWVRGIPQWYYHLMLGLGNVLTAWCAALVLDAGLVLFTLAKGEGALLWRLLPVILVGLLPVALASLVASALSVRLGVMPAGIIAVLFLVIGFLHPALETLANTFSGISKQVLYVFLMAAPNLYGMQKQGANWLLGEAINVHIMLQGLLFAYIFVTLLLVQKKKHA